MAYKRPVSADMIYFMLLVLDAFLKFANIKSFEYVIFVFLLISVLIRKINNEKYIYYSLFVPNVYLQLFAVGVYLILRKQLLNKRINKGIFCFISIISISALFNLLVHSGNVFQIVFQIVVYYIFIKFAQIGSKNHSSDELFNIFTKLFWVQIIIATIQLIYYRAGIDYIRGSFINAHCLGIFLVTYSFLLIMRRKKRNRFALIIALVWIIIADAKHVLVVFLFSLVIDYIFRKLKKTKNELLLSMIIMLVGIIGIICVFDNPPDFFEKNKLLYTYVLNPEYNKKVLFFSRTIKNMLSINGLLGFGVGLYGSQIAISMGKGVIYSWNSALSKYCYIAEPYKNAMKGLMTQGYTLYGIENSSMVLGYPMVSYIAMIAELGFFGFFVFIYIIEKEFKNCNKTLLIYFFILGIFDTYFEIPSVFVLLLIGTELTRKNNVK